MSAGSGNRDGLAFESNAGHWVLAVAVLGSGMAFLDGTVVNVALPDIGRDLDASTSSLQWVLNGSRFCCFCSRPVRAPWRSASGQGSR